MQVRDQESRPDDPSWPVPGRKPGDLLRAASIGPDGVKNGVVSEIVWRLKMIDAMVWHDSDLEACCDSELRESVDICQNILKRVSGQSRAGSTDHIASDLFQRVSAEKTGAKDCIGSRLVQKYRTIEFMTNDTELLKKCTDSEFRACRDTCHQLTRNLMDVISRQERLNPLRHDG